MNYPGHLVKLGESDADLVKLVAERLSALGYRSTSPSGVYDSDFKALVKLYQAQHVDVFARPLLIDGEIGPLTWGSLFPQPSAAASAPAGALGGAALDKAQSQVGVMEDPVGSNKGPMVNQYLASTNTPPGSFWCMAFVHWCFREAAKDLGVANTFPKTAGCLDAWNKSAGFRISQVAARSNPNLVVPGSVFIFDYGGGMGHAGIVVAQSGGALRTIEGNSNNDGSRNGVGVFELDRRNVMNTNLRGFIIVP